jgi:hypothetical protein
MNSPGRPEELTFGAMLPHGGASDFAGWRPAAAWARLRDAAQAFEDLGYDHLWNSDHLMADGADRSGLYFEAYSTLAAVSQVTERARLGSLVTCALYRNAGLLAKEAANVDVMSNGRLIFALGGGWDEQGCAAYGFDFPSAADRVIRFEETLEAVLRLWSDDVVDYDGAFVTCRAHGAIPRGTAAAGMDRHPRPARATSRGAVRRRCQLERRLGGVHQALGRAGRGVRTARPSPELDRALRVPAGRPRRGRAGAAAVAGEPGR